MHYVCLGFPKPSQTSEEFCLTAICLSEGPRLWGYFECSNRSFTIMIDKSYIPDLQRTEVLSFSFSFQASWDQNQIFILRTIFTSGTISPSQVVQNESFMIKNLGFPGGPVARVPCSMQGAERWIPGQGIPIATAKRSHILQLCGSQQTENYQMGIPGSPYLSP